VGSRRKKFDERPLFMQCSVPRRLIRAERTNGRHRWRPDWLVLEDRRVPAPLIVTSAADDGSANTLRWAIGIANGAGTPTSIEIELGTAPAAITLALGQLELTNTAQPITIYDGAGQGPVSISGNDASGVFDIAANVNATLSGLTITGGSTQTYGGGLYNAGTLTALNCTISGNTAYAGGGVFSRGAATLTDCTISGNSSAGSGGGLGNTGTVNLIGSTVADNTAVGVKQWTGPSAIPGAGVGGGVFDHGTANLTNSTICGNTATQGGGLFDWGQATLIACTVSGNSSPIIKAGGIYLYAYLAPSSNVSLNDTIVAGNTAYDFGFKGLGASITGSGSNNLTGTNARVFFQNGVDGNIVLSSLVGLDLAPLGNYGGPTQTMAVLPGSLAIGGGAALSGVTTDQRGDPLDSPAPDIGAYQTQGFTIAPVSGSTPQAAAVSAAFANPLAVTVTANEPDQPVAGGTVTYTASHASNGASANLSSATATIGDDGTAQVTATANSTSGAYTVTASIGAGGTAEFSLDNQTQPEFTGLSDPSIAYGTSSVMISGTLAGGPPASSGETVNITINGVTQLATIGSGGAFSTTFDTATLGVAGSPYSITYDYPGDVNYAFATATGTLTVTKATPTIIWANPADIAYGTALSATQLDATTSAAGTFTYTPAAGTILNVGDDQTLSVSFVPTDSADYNDTSGSAVINVDKATPVITWPDPADIIYGTALSDTQLDATASVLGTFTYTPPAGTVLRAGQNQTLSASFVPDDSADYNDAAGSAVINVDQATPTITWANPAGIVYGTALSATQLDATASVPGTFAYTPAAGAVLSAGENQTLSVTFTPTDSTDYSDATGTALINVDQVTTTITWTNPANIVYGTPLTATQLDATASVPGSFSYTPALGTVLPVGPLQTLSVSFTPTDSVNYTGATDSVTITVTRTRPTITWADPANIIYGTALSATQLDATASVPGTFTYTPGAGTVLEAGNDQTLSVSFVPTDSADYSNAQGSASINVDKATTEVTWPNPADIVYGTPLSGTQLDATASIPGTFSYTPAAGTLLSAAANQSLFVTFTPTDSTDFNVATGRATIDVDQATPTITWPNPVDIVYETPLSATQLDATASVPGTFTYTPAAGTILGAGDGQTLAVSFTPNDSVDFTGAGGSAIINVDRATPTITWANPAAIVYGTALSATQLDALASVPGSFTYTPAAGTVLGAGTSQGLSVSFTPTDSTDYTAAIGGASITVNKATPAITWANPVAITYGTALSATQLDATASVPGMFTYAPAAGVVLSGGASQPLSVNFTPTDSADYTTATGSAMINVDKATPAITWTRPAEIAYGTPLSGTQLDATASVAGSFTYSPALATVLDPGASQTLSVVFTPTARADYTTATGETTINVTKTELTITWAEPADITYGTALSATQLDASANIPGTFTYQTPAGAVFTVGSGQTLAATFMPADLTDYAPTPATATITVTKATPALMLSDAGGVYNGNPFAATATLVGVGADKSAAASLEGVAPTLTYYSGTGTSGLSLGSSPPVSAGSYTVVASFAGSTDYAGVQSAPVTFTIMPGTATVALTASTSSSVYGQPITLFARVTSSATPGGTVTFFAGGVVLGLVPVPGSGAAELTTSALATGAQLLTATYSGDGILPSASSAPTFASVRQSATMIVLVPDPVLKKKKVKSEILKAEIEPVSPGGGVPTGMVTFELLTKKKKKIKTKVLGLAAASGGAATIAFKPKLVLGKVLTVIYSGDTDFIASTSTAPKLSKKGLL
jgi:Bacterial Ig-like domain (group 3)